MPTYEDVVAGRVEFDQQSDIWKLAIFDHAGEVIDAWPLPRFSPDGFYVPVDARPAGQDAVAVILDPLHIRSRGSSQWKGSAGQGWEAELFFYEV